MTQMGCRNDQQVKGAHVKDTAWRVLATVASVTAMSGCSGGSGVAATSQSLPACKFGQTLCADFAAPANSAPRSPTQGGVPPTSFTDQPVRWH